VTASWLAASSRQRALSLPSSARRNKRVIVIGAGIGGLATAGALHRRGFEVEVYERAAELGEVGAGIQLAPNAVKVLEALGAMEALAPKLCALSEILSVAWDDAHLRFRQPLSDSVTRYGARYLAAHRADLHGALQALVPERAIHLGAVCSQVEVRGGSAAARFADGREAEGDLIIGCDGIHSAVRESLFGPTNARFTQLIAWRATVPIQFVPARIGPKGSVDIDPRSSYVGWIGPTGHVICYPIRGGETCNLFIGHFTDNWAEESWTVPSTLEDILAAHDGWNEALLGMFSNIQNSYKWGIYDRDPLEKWSVGPVTLVGDAAHPMMPTLAQGAAITLEDACAVARHLDAGTDVQTALAAYERERLPRARAVQLQSRKQFDDYRMTPPGPTISRDWIFSHDATRDPAAA
jgi:salicylate hydroxylase